MPEDDELEPDGLVDELLLDGVLGAIDELLLLPVPLLELDVSVDDVDPDGLLDEELLLGAVLDGMLEDELDVEGDVVEGVVVDDELELGGGVTVSVFWQPASAPSIRATPSAANAFLLMEPPDNI